MPCTATTELIEKVRKAYEDFEPYVIYQQVHNFCVVDMSAFYLDVLKDRLYVYKAGSKDRKSAQSALFKILVALTRLIAPVLSFTAEEIWDYIPAFTGKEDSVHLSAMPSVDTAFKDEGLKVKWERILALKQEVSKVLEGARREKVIGHPLDAKVKLVADGDTLAFLKDVEPFLEDVFICSGVEVAKGDGPLYGEREFQQSSYRCCQGHRSEMPQVLALPRRHRQEPGPSRDLPEVRGATGITNTIHNKHLSYDIKGPVQVSRAFSLCAEYVRQHEGGRPFTECCS